ncbi:MAG: S41 family peptidase [bacterium]
MEWNRIRRVSYAMCALLIALIAISTVRAEDQRDDPLFEANRRAYQIGQKNFQMIVQQIASRYEDPGVDLKKLFAHGLYGVERCLLADQVEGASATISLATCEPPYTLNEKQYLDRISTLIASRIAVTSATVASVTRLWTATLSSMVNALDDPYSQYLPPKNYGELQHFLSGEGNPEDQFYGVGIAIEWDYANRGILVREPIPGTPAFLANVQPGDLIVAVDDIPLSTTGTVAENLQAGVNRIRGPEGTKVKLTIVRSGAGPFPLNRVLVRKPMQPQLLISKEMLDEETAHLGLLSFYQNCSSDVEKALLWLREEGMKKLILDLRDDPGGFLDEAVKVADLFLPREALITYTQGRTPDTRKDFFDQRTGDEGFTQLPLVILVDSQSASASEVVTGALKDSGRAQVVGVKTFGKGSVQELFQLEGDAGLRLTVAKYYTPKGRCIHDQGIEPDLVVEPALTRENRGDAEEESDETKETLPKVFRSRLEMLMNKDNQLRAAYDLLNRKESAAR